MTAIHRKFTARVYLLGFVDASGLGLYLALSALFLNQAVGLTAAEVGLVLGVSGIASLVGAMPIARAAQRYGVRLGLVLLFAARAGAFLFMSTVDTLATALLAATLTGLMSRGTAPLIDAGLIGDADNPSAVKALAYLRMIRNAGMAIGGMPAGIAVWIDEPYAYRYALAASSCLFLLAGLVSLSLPSREMSRKKAPHANRELLRNWPLVALISTYGGLVLSAIILGVGMPLWIINQSLAPAWVVGGIQALNTILVVVLQRWASRGTEKFSRAVLLMRRAGLVSAGSCLLIAVGGRMNAITDIAIVFAVVILFTIAELYVVAGAGGAVLHHIPEGQRPTYLAAFNLGFAAATVVGPPAVAFSADAPPWVWLVWGAFFSLMAWLAGRLPKPRLQSQSCTIASTHGT